jgi:hypothetical protein
MFKPLIKKVREKSNNPSVLPENNSDELNAQESNEGFDDEHSSSSHPHRKRFKIFIH